MKILIIRNLKNNKIYALIKINFSKRNNKIKIIINLKSYKINKQKLI